MLLPSILLGSLVLSTLVRLLVESSLTDRVPLWGNLVGFVLQENRGIAFGIDLPLTLFLPLALLAVALILWAGLRARRWSEIIGYGLILGGALANLLDRVDDGVVTDFLQVGGFPVFNLADSCITVGVVLVLLDVASQGTGRCRTG